MELKSDFLTETLPLSITIAATFQAWFNYLNTVHILYRAWFNIAESRTIQWNKCVIALATGVYVGRCFVTYSAMSASGNVRSTEKAYRTKGFCIALFVPSRVHSPPVMIFIISFILNLVLISLCIVILQCVSQPQKPLTKTTDAKDDGEFEYVMLEVADDENTIKPEHDQSKRTGSKSGAVKNDKKLPGSQKRPPRIPDEKPPVKPASRKEADPYDPDYMTINKLESKAIFDDNRPKSFRSKPDYGAGKGPGVPIAPQGEANPYDKNYMTLNSHFDNIFGNIEKGPQQNQGPKQNQGPRQANPHNPLYQTLAFCPSEIFDKKE